MTGKSPVLGSEARKPRRTARLTHVVLVALVLGGFAALGSTALGGSGSTAVRTKSSAISPARCKRNQAAGTINYISPFGYDAAATIMEVFMAQKLGYFKAMCLKVAFNATSFTAEQLVSSGRGQVTAIGSAADHILAGHRRGNRARLDRRRRLEAGLLQRGERHGREAKLGERVLRLRVRHGVLQGAARRDGSAASGLIAQIEDGNPRTH